VSERAESGFDIKRRDSATPRIPKDLGLT